MHRLSLVIVLALASCSTDSRTVSASWTCQDVEVQVQERKYTVGIIPEPRTKNELWAVAKGDASQLTVRYESFPAWIPGNRMPVHRAEGDRTEMLTVYLHDLADSEASVVEACLFVHRAPIVAAYGHPATSVSDVGLVTFRASEQELYPTFGSEESSVHLANNGDHAGLVYNHSHGGASIGKFARDPKGTMRLIAEDVFLPADVHPETLKESSGLTLEQYYGVKVERMSMQDAHKVWAAPVEAVEPAPAEEPAGTDEGMQPPKVHKAP